MSGTREVVRRHTRGLNGLVMLAALLWLLAPVLMHRSSHQHDDSAAVPAPRDRSTAPAAAHP